MAEFFWERCENPVSTAIAASRIMYRIAKQTADLDRKSKYKENARYANGSITAKVASNCGQNGKVFKRVCNLMKMEILSCMGLLMHSKSQSYHVSDSKTEFRPGS